MTVRRRISPFPISTVCSGGCARKSPTRNSGFRFTARWNGPALSITAAFTKPSCAVLQTWTSSLASRSVPLSSIIFRSGRIFHTTARPNWQTFSLLMRDIAKAGKFIGGGADRKLRRAVA